MYPEKELIFFQWHQQSWDSLMLQVYGEEEEREHVTAHKMRVLKDKACDICEECSSPVYEYGNNVGHFEI